MRCTVEKRQVGVHLKGRDKVAHVVPQRNLKRDSRVVPCEREVKWSMNGFMKECENDVFPIKGDGRVMIVES